MTTLDENNSQYDFYSDKENLDKVRDTLVNSKLPPTKKAYLLERLLWSERRYTPHSIFNYV